MTKQNTAETVDIHKLALALLRTSTESVNIQQQVQRIVADFTKETIIPEWNERGDDIYADSLLNNQLVALIADIKDSGKNEPAKKRAIDDTVKRVGRACEAIDKALLDAKQPSPFRDSEDKLRKLTVSKGTKKNPVVSVKFGKAKADVTLQTHVANTIKWLDKNELTVTQYIKELEKQRDALLAEAKKADKSAK